MKNYSIKFLLLIVALAQMPVFAQSDKLEVLFKDRQYFELRDAVNKHSGRFPLILFSEVLRVRY